MSKKKSFLLFSLILFILIIFCCAIFFMFSLVSAAGNSVAGTQVIESGDVSQTIAVIDVKGEISSSEAVDFWGNSELDMVSDTIGKIDRAVEDDNVKAIYLRINSPGGEVYGTKRIYNKLQEAKEKDKVVVVLMQDVAASGGYYISTPADWIVASEMTLTGSIGVIFSTLDLSGLYEKVGVEQVYVVNTEGDLKVSTDLNDPNSDGYKVLQSISDDYYDNFVTVVADGRGMTKDEVIKLADGRVYSGRQAKNNGLVDQLGEEQEAYDKLLELADLDNPNIVLYTSQSSSLSLYGVSLLELINPGVSLLRQAESQHGAKAYYLSSY